MQTARVLLREWRDEDLAPFAAMNADPEVMRYFPSTLSRDESDALALRLRDALTQQGWGLWAAESDSGFIGFVGVARVRFTAHFTPCLELGWRLARHAQGRGLATEAGLVVRDFVKRELPREPVVSFTVPANQPSRRVMEKLGLRFDGEFDHPSLPLGHAFRRHVLYRL